MRQRPRRRREGRPTAGAVPVSGDRKRAGDAAIGTERLARGAPTRCTGHGPEGAHAAGKPSAHLTLTRRLTHHRRLPSILDRTGQAATARDPAQGTWWQGRNGRDITKSRAWKRCPMARKRRRGPRSFGARSFRPRAAPPRASAPVSAGAFIVALCRAHPSLARPSPRDRKAGRHRATRNANHMRALNSGMRADLARIASD